MNPQVFREYDIRGLVDSDFPKDEVRALGQAFGTYVRENLKKDKLRLSLGRDCRHSSDQLRQWLTEGLLSTGSDVVDIGVCPTPLFYFSLFNLEVDGGMMITASHNPPEFNGFKLCLGRDALYGPKIQEVRETMERGNFVRGQGKSSSQEVIPAYEAYVLKDIKIASPLKVVVDAGNGTGGFVAVPIMKELGLQVEPLYCDMNGLFPNHHPDPTVPENLKDLIARVKQTGADVGMAYDGDGDRLGVVDEEGRIIWGDELMIIFSRSLLERNPEAAFIAEVKCSQNLFDDIVKHGGRAIMWKTGHSLIKKKMKEEKALLAGEMSGHIFFADRYFGYDDAIYSSLRLLEVMAQKKQKLSQLLRDVPTLYSTPEIRVDCSDEKKFEVVKEAQKFFKKHHDVIDIDGARILFPQGWALIRASNTQPILVLRFEAKTPQALSEIRAEVEEQLERIKEEVTGNR